MSFESEEIEDLEKEIWALNEKLNEAITRVKEYEQIKAERGVLAKECAEFQEVLDSDARNYTWDYRYWLEWAAEEVAKRGEV